MIQQFGTDIAKFVRNGAPIVTKGQYQTRIGICNACEHIRHKTFSCGQCGCNMTLKAKFGTSKCPIDKWGTEIKKK